MALLIPEFCAYNHHSPLTVQAPNFCASCVGINIECLVTWGTHAQKPKFPANQWNVLEVSTEFSAPLAQIICSLQRTYLTTHQYNCSTPPSNQPSNVSSLNSSCSFQPHTCSRRSRWVDTYWPPKRSGSHCSRWCDQSHKPRGWPGGQGSSSVCRSWWWGYLKLFLNINVQKNVQLSLLNQFKSIFTSIFISRRSILFVFMCMCTLTLLKDN